MLRLCFGVTVAAAAAVAEAAATLLLAAAPAQVVTARVCTDFNKVCTVIAYSAYA